LNTCIELDHLRLGGGGGGGGGRMCRVVTCGGLLKPLSLNRSLSLKLCRPPQTISQPLPPGFHAKDFIVAAAFSFSTMDPFKYTEPAAKFITKRLGFTVTDKTVKEVKGREVARYGGDEEVAAAAAAEMGAAINLEEPGAVVRESVRRVGYYFVSLVCVCARVASRRVESTRPTQHKPHPPRSLCLPTTTRTHNPHPKKKQKHSHNTAAGRAVLGDRRGGVRGGDGQQLQPEEGGGVRARRQRDEHALSIPAQEGLAAERQDRKRGA
jgi:hypothetical protein